MGGTLAVGVFGLLAVGGGIALGVNWHGVGTRTFEMFSNHRPFGSTYAAMGDRGYRVFLGSFLCLIGLAVLALDGWVVA